MVQVLPYIQGVGERTAPYISQALSDIAGSIKQRSGARSDQRILEGLSSNPEMSVMDQIKAFSALTPNSQSALAPIYAKILPQQTEADIKKRGEQQALADTQKIFNEQVKLLADNATGIGVSPGTKLGLSRKGTENRAYFDTLRQRYEKVLLPQVNKGAISDFRFNYIMDLIPKASDSQRVIAGKLRGLATELGLDPSGLNKISDFNTNLKNSLPEQGQTSQATAKKEAAKSSKGKVWMKAPDGSSVQIPDDQIEAALNAGGQYL